MICYKHLGLCAAVLREVFQHRSYSSTAQQYVCIGLCSCIGQCLCTACAQQARGDPPSPVHGPNQWPRQLPDFDAALRKHIASCLTLGQALMRGVLALRLSVSLLAVTALCQLPRAGPVD